jgi:hypothetical protein
MARVAARPAVGITVLPAVEAQPQRIPPQYPHAGAGISAPRADVKSQAAARLAVGPTVGLTAQPAVVRPTAETGSKWGHLPLNF